MKGFLILALVMLVVGCTKPLAEADQTLYSDDTGQPSEDSVDEDVSDIDSPPVVQEYPMTDPEPTLKGLDVSLTSLEVSKTTYSKDQEHELRLFVYDAVRTAAVNMTPRCGKDDNQISVLVNKLFVETIVPECDKVLSIKLPTEYFVDGGNVILIRTDSEEQYAMEEVSISLDAGNGVQVFEGSDFMVPKSTGEVEVFSTLNPVRALTTFTRTFNLRQQDLVGDVVFSFRGSEREGSVKVLLNGQEVFDQVPGKTNEVVLPLDHLVAGVNTLDFVVRP